MLVPRSAIAAASLAAASLVPLVSAGCPYAARSAAPAPPGCPYAARAAAGAESVPEKRHVAHHHKAAAGNESYDGIFYMNRIGPSGGQLWISNADGTNATLLLGNQSHAFDYHPSWSQDGEWIVFTREARAPGQSDLYRVRPDGSGLEVLAETDSVEDAGVLSPDGTKVAYVSTGGNYTTNIWISDLVTGAVYNLTDTNTTRADNTWPTGHFRPAWSPDGEWLAFSSDRNTDWTGHSDGVGWEHTQTLGIYAIRPNGSDFRTVARDLGYSYGTPAWSPDGTRIIYNEMTTNDTYFAHGISDFEELVGANIYSVDFATGNDTRLELNGTSPDGTLWLRVKQQFIGNSSNIGYLIKAGDYEGINYTVTDSTHKYFNYTNLRNPSWSPDGSKLVYEVPNWDQQPVGLKLWSYQNRWDYRYMDVFPQLSAVTGRMATTQKVEGYANGSAITQSTVYDDLVTVLDSYSIYSEANETEVLFLEEGESGAFQPSFNPDGDELVVGFGAWFVERSVYNGSIWRVAANGSFQYPLTDGSQNAGFPSWSPDGTAIVYRLWSLDTGAPLGLHILNFTTGETTQLTWGWDNTPGWSPDGERIVFTRNDNWTEAYGARWYSDRFDIFTIRPDGTDLTQVTDSLSNDAHAVWSHDGRIMWNTGMWGFKDESQLYDDTFQPYGQIMIMDYDGSNKQLLTDTIWEDSMPLYVPNDFLPGNITQAPFST